MPGALAIVLHTHMPYVEGHGTWPFGEEWLWEAVATSYLPLVDVLERAGDPVTVSMTPVLADQLAQPEVMARCRTFLEEIRPESHRRDAAELRAAGEPVLAGELERSAAEYAAAARRLAELERRGGLLAALAPHVSWTSSATHAVLPLLATDAGRSLQIQSGITSHRSRFGAWAGGFWLPECAHDPTLDVALEQAGVRAACVELTTLFGPGDPRHLRPIAAADGPLLWPIDRMVIDRVWGRDGYPSRGPYRDSHRHTTHRHNVWRVDGRPYDHAAALVQARSDAAEFVAAALDRVADGGVSVCALDTELLGHWWYEGVHWLSAVIDEAKRQGLALSRLDDGSNHVEPVRARLPPAATSWGEGGDLRTWTGPQVAALAGAARTAELRVAAAGRPSPRALRELLALQSSDWAFLATRRTAGDYPRERFEGHRAALERALDGELDDQPALRGLAPQLRGWG